MAIQKIASNKQYDLSMSQSLDQEAITPDYFVMNYLQFLSRYISKGRPTADTLRDYRLHINSFIRWCSEHDRHPLAMHDYQMRMYMEFMFNRKYSDNTIAIKLAAIRAFYHAACKIGLIEINPCADLKAERKLVWDEKFRFYSSEQIQTMCDYIKNNKEDNFIRYRDMSILYLMAVEGFRNVEIHRMCDEDINWDYKSIAIRSKGHGGIVYPCNQTFEVLKRYLEVRPNAQRENNLTPTIVSTHRRHYSRISRNGIREIMNEILSGCNLKHPGYSCHILRHSCGTNLYAKTKDLHIVQMQLRHTDPNMAARYAHVHERMNNRCTSCLAPEID
ncbi:integrase/recombinase XerC [Selenomonas ruminantium]|uniref:Integrase/recombinase XerC n=1 Tax=Selenomonas ruminantium TaxID=971 RepID=A0A1M6WPW9_SELRU|nr:tyrosine-type recombinase/integrase [Selenomonas ruminantium]SHK95731.1 integrase/recombinase XerC [Selenomonas ruminantium]